MIRRLSPIEAEKCEWAFPAFGVPKKDKKSIRTVGDFRKLNAHLDRTPCCIEPINDMLMSLGAWTWGSAFDLNMGCYAMRLCQKTRTFVRLITIWGMHECLVLWMGTSPASDVFQGRLQNILMSLEPRPPKVHIDDILAVFRHTFEEHLKYVDDIMTRLQEAGLQVNINKSALFQKELECLGFWLTTQGYKPLDSRVQGTLDMLPPRNIKEVRIFVGMVSFIKNHIHKRARIMEPITRLTKNEVRFKWEQEQQAAFEELKAKCAEQMMLVCPRVDKVFDLCSDSCDTQIGAFLTQEGLALGCFSRKMNTAQTRHPVTDKELLAIYEGLKHFKNILKGGENRCFCDHKNLNFGAETAHASQRVLRQMVETSDEHAAKIMHIDGENNSGGDGVRRMPTEASVFF